MNTNNTVDLPEVVTRYFDATNRFDADSAAACFEPTATVRDEAKTHVGTAAIKGWVAHSSQQYQPHASVLGARQDGEKLVVSALVTGQFPGSPVELHFSFGLRSQKIANLSVE